MYHNYFETGTWSNVLCLATLELAFPLTLFKHMYIDPYYIYSCNGLLNRTIPDDFFELPGSLDQIKKSLKLYSPYCKEAKLLLKKLNEQFKLIFNCSGNNVWL